MSIESPLKQYHHSFLTIHLINLFRASTTSDSPPHLTI